MPQGSGNLLFHSLSPSLPHFLSTGCMSGCPALAERALKSFLPFATTCESGFSTLK
ncbi:hypothetical protein KUCAC02_023584, partial [Chaenocephalus aceratus]